MDKVVDMYNEQSSKDKAHEEILVLKSPQWIDVFFNGKGWKIEID